MSVLEKIKFDKALEQLGLKESQVQVIYSNEIEALKKQEAVLLEHINQLSIKSNDLYAERKKFAESFEVEKITLDKAKAELVTLRNEISNGKKELEQEKRDVASLHIRLDEDREQYRQERIIFAEKVKAVEEKEKLANQSHREALDKDRDLDKIRDEVYLKLRDLNESVKKADEIKSAVEVERNELVSAKNALAQERQAYESQKEEFLKRQSVAETSFQEAKEKIESEKKAHETEIESEKAALREREYKIIEQEKKIENEWESIKAAKQKH